jgi:thiol:disulfide interchange protein DsbD
MKPAAIPEPNPDSKYTGILMHVLARLLTLFILLFAGVPAHAIDPDDLLEPDKAFRFSARAIDAATIEVTYRVAKGYYLYRDRFVFEVEPKTASLGAAQFPPGLVHEDKFFGKQEIYRGDLRFTLPVKDGGNGLKLVVTSQGCADVGVCYVPHKQSANIRLAGASVPSSSGMSLREQLMGGNTPEVTNSPRGERAPSLGSAASDTDIAALFETGGFWLVLASFFGFGLLLAFTPCMLPMIPILSGIIVGEGRDVNKLRAFILSLAYVLGMAVAYAAAGVTAAWSGTLLAAALQNVWVLTTFALVFVALALSMFGLYELQLPSFLHHRLHATHHKLEGGRVATVALMGALSAIIVSPCVAAPLAGALLYISQSRDLVMGGAALFVMALGMGVPLIVVGVSEGALLPKSGVWMNRVKQIFGVLLLAVAVWIVSPLIPVAAQMLAWAALLVVAAVLLRAVDALPANAGMGPRVAKALGLITLVAGIAMLVGVLSGNRDPLNPLGNLMGQMTGDARETVAPVHFERVKTLAELETRVKSAGRPVMLDFYADWCVTCKEMERYTFTDRAVQVRLAGMLLLQVDVTANTADDQALLKRFRLFGPPGIVFFDARGDEVRNVRVIGYQSAVEFLKSLDRLVL